MFQAYEDIQKLGKSNLDAAVKSATALTRGLQTIAAETADYSKKAIEHSTSHVEKLTSAQTPERFVELQSDYAKGAYEALVAQATKVGELYTNLAREAFRPMEGVFAQAGANFNAPAKSAA